jgi:hypothetical protein
MDLFDIPKQMVHRFFLFTVFCNYILNCTWQRKEPVQLVNGISGSTAMSGETMSTGRSVSLKSI